VVRRERWKTLFVVSMIGLLAAYPRTGLRREAAAVPSSARGPAGICPFVPTGTDEEVVQFALSVTPKGAALSAPWYTNALTAGFTVKNNGTCTDSVNASAAVGGPLSVALVSPNYFGLAPGAQTTVWVTYNTSLQGSATLTLTAVGLGNSDNGSYNVTIGVGYRAVVTPQGTTTPTRSANTSGYTATFTVQNVGYYTDTLNTSACTGYVDVTCTGTTPSSVILAAGASQTVTASYNVQGPGTGRLAVSAVSAHSSGGGWYAVPVTAVAGAPLVDQTPYNYAKQDYGLCAVSCFAGVYRQSTVPYFSYDTPRSVTLAYNSDRVNPRPFVLVNVSPDLTYAQTPVQYRLQATVKWDGVNATAVTFLNGENTLRFAYAGSAPVRLGGQFDVSTQPTGAYPMDIVVSALFPDSTLRTTDIATRLVVVNETSSPIAAGWTLAGIQHLYFQTADSAALITEGDGSAVYFAHTPGMYSSPGGEFSKLITSTLSGTNGWARIYPDSSKAVFDNTGKLVQLRDRFNNTATITYDGSGRVWKVIDPASLTITLTYGANGLASIQDPGSPARTTTVTVDGSRHLTGITDPDNVSTTFVIGGNLLLSNLIDRRGDTTQFVYDTLARKLTSSITPPVLVFGSPNPVYLRSSVAPWQEVGVPYTSTASTPAAAPRADTVRARVTDARGYTTVYQVDAFGAITRVDDAAGRTTTFIRDTNSHVLRDSLPSGHIVRRTWNGANPGQLWDSTTTRTINYAYEPTWNQLVQVSGDADSLWNYWSSGHLDSTVAGARSTTNPLRRKTIFTHDALGRLVTHTDPGGHADTMYYHATGWQNTDSSRAGGRRTAYLYDGYGRTDTTSISPTSVTAFAYDVLNRRTSIIGPMSDTTVYTYDSLFLRQMRDAIGQTYQFGHNAVGWVTSRTDPAGKQDQYQYDSSGNVRQVTNRRNQVIAWAAYDALNRPTSVTADGKTTTFGFDSHDGFTAVANDESTDTVKVDAAGRVQAQISVRAGTRYELRSTHNTRGLPDTLRMVSPWADTIAYHYNASLALDTLRDLAGGRMALGYDQHLLNSTRTLPNGLSDTLVYPSTHTTAQVTYSNGSVTSAVGAKYDYDTLGLVSDRHNLASNDTIINTGRDYTNDPLGRLTRYGDYSVTSWNKCIYEPGYGWDCSSNSSKTYSAQEFYGYDKVGNRTDSNAVILPGNRLVRGYNGDSLVYDDDGNLITRMHAGSATQRLYWSSLGRLDSVWTSVGTVSFGYDPAGRRVRKTLGSTTTRYVYSGDNLVAEVDGGTPTTPLAEYTYYPGVDQPYSLRRRMRSDSVFYYAQDYPGNVVGLVNGTQSLVAQYKYKPYGADNGSSPGTVPNPFRFAARQLDSETGLYYMRARYYDPQLGRFLSEDPIGLAGGINTYVYAGDNPVNGRDPSGEVCQPHPMAPPARAAGGGGQCNGGGDGGGGGDRGVGGWFGPDDSPYIDMSSGSWSTADLWDFYVWAMAQPGDHVSGEAWIAAGRPRPPAGSEVNPGNSTLYEFGGIWNDFKGLPTTVNSWRTPSIPEGNRVTGEWEMFPWGSKSCFVGVCSAFYVLYQGSFNGNPAMGFLTATSWWNLWATVSGAIWWWPRPGGNGGPPK
jgi:RHS repeat-associated protein